MSFIKSAPHLASAIMSILRTLLTISAMAVSAFAFAEGSFPGYIHVNGQLLEDVDADSYQKPGWMAIKRNQGASGLVPVKFQVQKVLKDGALQDIQITSNLGNVETVSGNADGVIAYINHPTLSTGPIKSTRFEAIQFGIGPEKRQHRIHFNSDGYVFSRKGNSVRLLLNGKAASVDKRSVIGTVNSDPARGELSDMTIIWGGDVNRDGVLDFIIYYGGEKAADVCLLLSERGAFIRFKTAACQMFSG